MSERSPSGAHRDGADGAGFDADHGSGTACGVSIRLEEQAALAGYAAETGESAAPAVVRCMIKYGDNRVGAREDAAIEADTLRPAPSRSL